MTHSSQPYKAQENDEEALHDRPVKFLVIRFSSIGDIVLTTTALRCLKQQVKNVEVHFLTKPGFVPVIRANPYIDRIHVFTSLTKTIKILRQENFNYIVDLHHNLRSAIIKSALPGISFSFDKLNLEKWLMVNSGINRMPDVHIVDRYLDTLKLFDVNNDHLGLDYFIPSEDEIDVAGLPPLFHEGYIVFVIGGNHATKRLPPEKIISITRKIRLPVILAGGREDADLAGIIADACGNDMVLNTCGLYNINQSASLVRGAEVVISHDTGLMHIAAAFKKKIISLWGNTVPAFGMYPYLSHPDSAAFEVKGLKCRPCSKLGYSRCPRKHFKCMVEQDSGKIAELARRLFAVKKEYKA